MAKPKTRAAKKSAKKVGFRPTMAIRNLKKPEKTKANKSSKTKLNKSKKMKTLRPKAFSTKIIRELRTDKIGRSFLQIVQKAPKHPDRYNTNMVRVIQDWPGRIKRLGVYHKAVATKTNTVDDKKHEMRKWKQVIYARDPAYSGKIHECPQVVVRCECPRHRFMWEYALWNAGAAEVLEPNNGEAPQKHNIALRPGCCKHLLMAYEKLKEANL